MPHEFRPSEIPWSVDHVAYIAGLVGVEHVGIGLDFFDTTREEYQRRVDAGLWNPREYPPRPYEYPAGIEGPARIPELAETARRRGFDEPAVAGVLGANFLRVFEAVWR